MEESSATSSTSSCPRVLESPVVPNLPEKVLNASSQLQGLVESALPMKSAGTRVPWESASLSFLWRMSSVSSSIGDALLRKSAPAAAVLLRTVYEHHICHAWISIDPGTNLTRWQEDAIRRHLVLHREAAQLGAPALTEDEAAEAESARGGISLADQALAVDGYWPNVLPAFRRTEGGEVDLLTARGLYTGMYRPLSGFAHGGTRSFEPNIEVDEDSTVTRIGGQEIPDRYFLVSIPLLAMSLLVHCHLFDWPDEDELKSFLSLSAEVSEVDF